MDSRVKSIKVKKLLENFNYLKEKTNNFTQIKAELFQENTRYLSLFRIILGITTHELSKKLDISYSWIHTLETTKKNIKFKTAQKIARKIENLLKINGFFGNVNKDEFLQNYYSLTGLTKKDGVSKLINNVRAGDFNSFIEIVKLVKNKTNDFSYFPSSLILEDSRILSIIRILFGLSQAEFAKKLKMSKMTIEELENGYRKIKWPVTARKYSKRLQKLFKKIESKNNLESIWQKWVNKIKVKESKDVGWKTIRKMNVRDFKKYFSSIKKITSGFKKFDEKMFQKSPQIITVFRILLGLTQRELERKLSLKGRVISNYECRNYKTLSIGRSKMFAKFFEKEFKSKKLQNVTLNFAVERFIEVKESMYNHRKASLIGLKSLDLTKQEKMILRNLKSLHKGNFRIEKHSNVETRRGIINTDFAVYLENELIAVIEATSFLHTKSKKFSYNLKNRIYLTDYRFLKIKESFPNVKTFFVIDMEDNPILRHRIKKSITNETIAIDNIFINDEKDKLSQLVNNLMRVKYEKKIKRRVKVGCCSYP